ncbi:hypothetical protein HDU97_001972 [Phlyctochytrium planicorne]|nr:hypothetical protein HDU97_001972 [Phlyctochytrium planicorne]
MPPLPLPSIIKAPTAHLIALTQKLLNAIAAGDWETYLDLTTPSMTCFEPEAGTHLVSGLPFHQFYFTLAHRNRALSAPLPVPPNTTIVNPTVTLLSQDGTSALVAYVRLIQKLNAEGQPITVESSETRIWVRDANDWEKWRNVHFHRSVAKL